VIPRTSQLDLIMRLLRHLAPPPRMRPMQHVPLIVLKTLFWDVSGPVASLTLPPRTAQVPRNRNLTSSLTPIISSYPRHLVQTPRIWLTMMLHLHCLTLTATPLLLGALLSEGRQALFRKWVGLFAGNESIRPAYPNLWISNVFASFVDSFSFFPVFGFAAQTHTHCFNTNL